MPLQLRRTALWILLGVLLPCARGHALGFHFGLQTFGGAGSSLVADGTTNPTQSVVGVGAAAGIGFKKVLVGAVTDFRWISQVSAVQNGSGNRRGVRWTQISPALFLFLGKVQIQLETQFLGDYTLTNLTPEGATVRYQSPLGAKLAVGYYVGKNVFLGAYAESVLFRKQTVTQEKELHPPLHLWHAGLQLTFAPGKGKK